MKVALSLVLAMACQVSVMAHATLAQPACRFVLGFATLRDLVGAQKVGQCLEDEHFNLENGNSEQHTSGGLMVWRKIDNFTAFTDGGTSWINGPNGLQSRPNGERFSWEKDPVRQVPPSVPPSVPAAAPPPAPSLQPNPPPPSLALPTTTPTPRLVQPTPIPAAISPPSRLPPELAARCTNLGFELPSGPVGSGGGATAAGAAQEVIRLCRAIVDTYGEPGFNCFAPAVREMYRTAPRLGRGNGGLAVQAMEERVDLCLSTLTP